jgi:hypothetical protein
MKVLLIHILFFFIPAIAAPLLPEDVHSRLEPLALKADHPTVFKSQSEITVTLPSEKPRGDEKQEWISSHVTAFIKGQRMVRQIAIETENCKVTEAELNKSDMQERVQNLVKTVSSQVFGKPFELDGERYFKELGPHWNQSVHVKIREQFPEVRGMRLSRGISKCDARRGYRFRFDFFLQ